MKILIFATLLSVFVAGCNKDEDEIPATSVQLDKKEIELQVNESYQFSVVCLPGNARNPSYMWTSDNEKIASVDNEGKVTALSGGEATITISANSGDIVLKDSCKVKVPNGNWTCLYDIEGAGRCDAVGVAWENHGYFGTGINSNGFLNDFWRYDPVYNTYTQLSNFAGSARKGSVAFACANKIYIGTGYDGTTTEGLADFYEYDIDNDTWTQIDDLPGGARYGAVAFSVDDKGYVGTGYNNAYLKDFYQYNPTTSKWEQITGLYGNKRKEAVAFVIDNVAYVGMGVNNNNYIYDFWKFDPSDSINNTWILLRNISNTNENESYDDDYNDIVGAEGVAFTSGGKGYITTGGRGTSGKVTWEYDPSTDLWHKKTDFEGLARKGAIAFTLNDVGYVLTGFVSNGYYSSDIWYFQPEAKQDDNDNGSNQDF